MKKYEKSIGKKSIPQELEKIGAEFFISVPLEAFLEVVFIHWAYESPVLQPDSVNLKLLFEELD